MRRQRTSAPWLLVWLALAAWPAQAGLDRSIENMMGRDARAAIESAYRVVQTPAVVGFVNRVGQRVAAASPRQMTYTFRVIETDEVNAMALPSGDVYVTTGLLAFIESQDELAGVLGHEIGHVAAKHSLRAFKKQFWTGMLFGAVNMPSGLETAGQLATTLYFLRYSRKDEAEADQLGAQIALGAGYDPFALPGFMERLGKAHEGRLSTVEGWFTTHPEPERRASRLEERKELDPSRLTTVVTIGKGYLDRHFAAEATLRLRRAETLAPQDAQVQLLLARANLAAGLTEQAAEHAARATALDSGLAEEADNVAQAAAGAQAPAGAPPPVPEDVDQRVEESLRQVATSQQAAKAAAEGLSERLKTVADTRRKLAERTERTAQDLQSAAREAGASGERETLLRRSAGALALIEEAVGRLGSVAKASAAGAQQARTTGEMLAERLRSAASPAEKAQFVRLADRYVADVERRGGASAEISQDVDQALTAAGAAAQHLSSAMDVLSRRSGVAWGSDRLALDSARSSLDAAEKEAKKASDGARRAGALQSEAAVNETTWSLDMETLALRPAEQTQVEAIVADYLGTESGAVRTAREEAGGLGSGALRLIAQAQPAEQKSEKTKEPAEIRPEQEAGVDVLLALMRRDVQREIAATKRVAENPEAEEPTAPEPPESDAPKAAESPQS